MATIADLGRLVKQKYPGAYDDMADDSLGVMVKQKYPGAYDDFADAPAQPSQPSGLMRAMRGRSQATGAADLLPAILGGGAGLAAGRIPVAGAITPVRTAAAGVGGFAGEGLRRAATGQPFSLEEMAKQAGIQATSEAAGGALAKGARWAGKGLMQGAVRPLLGDIKEYKDALGGIVPTMIRERIPVGKLPFTPKDRTGSIVANARRQDSAQRLKIVLDEARDAGVRFGPKQLLGPVKELVRDMKGQPLNKGDIAAVDKMVQEFIETHPGPLTPQAVKTLKRNAWSLARPVLKAEKAMPGATQADRVVEARFNRAIGQGAERALSGLRTSSKKWSGPRDVRGIEGRTKALIGAQRAVERAEDVMQSGIPLVPRGWGGWIAGPGLGAAVGGAASPDDRRRGAMIGATAGVLGTYPPVMSRLALGATNPISQEALRQIPRPLLSLLFPPEPFNPQPRAAKEE